MVRLVEHNKITALSLAMVSSLILAGRGSVPVLTLYIHTWYYTAFALSIINLALWSYNLFVFLLLRVLPLYFDKNKTPPVDMAYTVVPIPKTNAN